MIRRLIRRLKSQSKKLLVTLHIEKKLLRDHLHVKGMPRIAAWDDIKKERVGSFLFDFIRYMPEVFLKKDSSKGYRKDYFTAKAQSN